MLVVFTVGQELPCTFPVRRLRQQVRPPWVTRTATEVGVVCTLGTWMLLFSALILQLGSFNLHKIIYSITFEQMALFT